ncbi:hypothetical protein OVA24_08710 [Luteolibacter sp. SL250]|uniref:hypothetical protein n=1 Tax=Luteolibacter sp. SL250 TaxID=2995170 RepID=UPI00226E8C9C|nr:hypothetical protein [Luteolibacter sp. SL250]WAC21466.1 hypothetical protein OVA24_08710 [Luteolibacter sp. SL250]
MNTKSKDSRNTKNPLEWAVFGLSSLLVAGVIVFLGWSAITLEDRPAAFRVDPGDAIRTSGTTVVPVHITNTGSTTAAEVTVVVGADFASGGKESTLTIDFIPRGGSREVRAVFTGTEMPTTVTARVAGYVEP